MRAIIVKNMCMTVTVQTGIKKNYLLEQAEDKGIESHAVACEL